MGVEWRVFQPSTVEEFEQHVDAQEHRVDTYLLFTENVSLGLKLRGDESPLVELKVRGARDKFGLERWMKPIAVPLDSSIKAFSDEDDLLLTDEAYEAIMQTLTESVEDSYEASVHLIIECLKLLKDKKYVVVRTEKRRNQQSFDKYLYEQAWFKYVYVKSDEQKRVEGYTRSICCEGTFGVAAEAKHIVDQYVAEKKQGYPEYLASLITKSSS